MRKFHGEGGEGLKSVCFLYMNETKGEKKTQVTILATCVSCTRSGNQELNPHTTQIIHKTLIHTFINVNLLNRVAFLWCNIAVQWCIFYIFAPH